MATDTSRAPGTGAGRGVAVFLGLALGIFAIGSGCDRPERAAEIQAIDASGKNIPRDFALTDPAGRQRHLAEFRGKVVALFFGFTRCPDVCPTTLTEFVQVYRMLGAQAGRVQVIFVTIDPERDTREVLAEYMPAFDSRFLGLLGTPAEISRVARAFDVTYEKVPGTTPGEYTMDHTAYVFLIDPSGQLRLKVPYGQPADSMAKLIRELLD